LERKFAIVTSSKCPNCLVRRPYVLRSLAIDIEVKILLRDCLVSSVFQQISERIVQGVLQIEISFSEADGSRRVAKNL